MSDHHVLKLLQQRLGSDELSDVEALVVLPSVWILHTCTLMLNVRLIAPWDAKST